MEKEHKVVVDTSKCIGCGLCVKDCVTSEISIKKGKAVPVNKYCILCGHCEAVCPKGAISLTGYSEQSEEIENQVRLNPDELLAAIKTRRTIRQFKDTIVPENVKDMIIEAGRLAPTGCNYQDTTFYILGSKQAELEAMAVSFFLKLSKVTKHVIPFLKNITIDDHFFFKGAPLVIVLTGNKVGASLAAENMAFMAEANGLGVLYSGFYTTVVNKSANIRKIMGIKRGENAVTTLVIGYPDVKYYRTVKRNTANIKEL